jgi:hypothetical protein
MNGEDFFDRIFLPLARDWHDWPALADGLDRLPPGPLTIKFFQSILRGEVKRPAKPMAKAATWTRQMQIVGLVEKLRADGARDPVRQAMQQLGTSRRTVDTAKSVFKRLSAEDQEFVLIAVGCSKECARNVAYPDEHKLGSSGLPPYGPPTSFEDWRAATTLQQGRRRRPRS